MLTITTGSSSTQTSTEQRFDVVCSQASHSYLYPSSNHPPNGSGNSIPSGPLAGDVLKCAQRLRSWLGDIFKKRFTLQAGQPLEIGVQVDGHSCGICVMNSMEH